MKFFSAMEKSLLRLVDFYFACMPAPLPDSRQLQNCKIVSHRGEHDNRKVFENTLPAFDRAGALGIWGIEFDVRWTRDLQPVVTHDPDLRRVFGLDLVIGQTNLADLKIKCPLVPSLAEVIQSFGKRLHLMVELKQEAYPDPERQNRVLEAYFAGLRPGDDFHFISLAPEMFNLIKFAPPSAFLPVAMLKVCSFSRLALQKHFGGICGHFLLLTGRRIKRHHQQQQGVGVGYPRSKNSLLRELHRRVDWIFSNNAAALQDIVDSLQRRTIQHS